MIFQSLGTIFIIIGEFAIDAHQKSPFSNYRAKRSNRIFGFDGWNRETLESSCVLPMSAEPLPTILPSMVRHYGLAAAACYLLKFIPGIRNFSGSAGLRKNPAKNLQNRLKWPTRARFTPSNPRFYWGFPILMGAMDRRGEPICGGDGPKITKFFANESLRSETTRKDD
jgi:hypothetical protein